MSHKQARRPSGRAALLLRRPRGGRAAALSYGDSVVAGVPLNETRKLRAASF